MNDDYDDITFVLPRSFEGIILVAGDEQFWMRDDDAMNNIEWRNPVKSAVIVARLRAWADLIESQTLNPSDA